MDKEIVITAAVRTPIGSLLGMYNDISAIELGSLTVKAALSNSKLSVNDVDEVIIGNVLHAGLGQNVARQIALQAGIPETVSAYTIDMVCGSGMKAIQIACQSIQSGDSEIVVAGGSENMSQAPFALNNYRVGRKLGNAEMIDTLLSDGLTDAFNGYHMGVTAENIVEKYGISREEQDRFSLQSLKRAQYAKVNGVFQNEIVPVVKQERKGSITLENDEHIRENTDLAKLSQLNVVFKENGTVTAGNSSGINDGAAILVIMSKEKAEELGAPILGKIVSYATAGVEPELMGTGPIPATKKALEKVGWSVADLDLVEANEAFAAQAICVMRELGLNPEIMNVNGGAIALGHPIGSSGARIIVTLLHEMNRRNAKKGLATLCIGGGQGAAILIEGGQ